MLFISAGAFSQTEVKATLDTNSIIIGDQIAWRLQVDVEPGTDVLFPVYVDSVVNNVEMLEAYLPDTLSDEAGKLTIEKKYLITCFDSGAYFMPSAPVVLNMKDTVFSEALFLGVNTVAIDTAQAIKDIVMPYDVPFALSPLLKKIIYISMSALLLAVILFFGIRYYRKNKPEEEEPEVYIIPHEHALKRLAELQQKALWKENKHKENQSELTDIIREYIEYAYKVPALEMISDDIIEAMRQKGLANEQQAQLRQMFSLADLTKFAKHIPLDAEHEHAVESAFAFVKATSAVVSEPEETNN